MENFWDLQLLFILRKNERRNFDLLIEKVWVPTCKCTWSTFCLCQLYIWWVTEGLINGTKPQQPWWLHISAWVKIWATSIPLVWAYCLCYCFLSPHLPKLRVFPETNVFINHLYVLCVVVGNDSMLLDRPCSGRACVVFFHNCWIKPRYCYRTSKVLRCPLPC